MSYDPVEILIPRGQHSHRTAVHRPLHEMYEDLRALPAGQVPKMGPGGFEGTLPSEGALVATGNAGADTAALQGALNDSPAIALRGDFVVDAALAVPSGRTIIAHGASITQSANLTATLGLNGVEDVQIVGLQLIGVGTDYTDASTSLAAAGVLLTNASRVVVRDCVLRNHAGAGVRLRESEDVSVVDCVISGPAAQLVADSNFCGGVWIGGGGWGGSPRTRVSGCSISDVAQGIFTTAGSHGLRITDNAIHNVIGQHGLYINATKDIIVSDNVIRDTVFQGMKIQIGAGATDDTEGAVVTGNTIRDTGSHAILMGHTSDASTAVVHRGVVIADNTIEGAGERAVSAAMCDGAVITGNMARDCQTGIDAVDCVDTTIQGNRLHNLARQGIWVRNDKITSKHVAVVGNAVVTAGTSAGASTQFGIHSINVEHVTIDGNFVRDTVGNMRYAIWLQGGAVQPTAAVVNNDAADAADYGIRLEGGASTIRAWHGNRFQGGLGDVLSKPTSAVFPFDSL